MDPFPHELFCGRRGAGEDGREAGCLFCGRGKQDGAGGRRREAGGGRREARSFLIWPVDGAGVGRSLIALERGRERRCRH